MRADGLNLLLWRRLWLALGRVGDVFAVEDDPAVCAELLVIRVLDGVADVHVLAPRALPRRKVEGALGLGVDLKPLINI